MPLIAWALLIALVAIVLGAIVLISCNIFYPELFTRDTKKDVTK